MEIYHVLTVAIFDTCNTCKGHAADGCHDVSPRESPNGRIQDLAPFDITVTYLPDSGIIKTDKIRNVQFSGNSRKWKEGDTGQEVELAL